MKKSEPKIINCYTPNLDTYLLINNRYEMYLDGVVYDTQKGDDIPQWIFTFRDFVLEIDKNKQ